MILISDYEYRQSKLIKLGKKRFPKKYSTLKKAIERKYNVSVLNIIKDRIANGSIKRPRLQIVLEYSHEYSLFSISICEYDNIKQREIKELYLKTVNEKERIKAEDVFIIFGDFEKLAIEEANCNITQSDIKKIVELLNDPRIWTISIMFSQMTIFLKTTNMLDENNNDLRSKAREIYWNILQKRDDLKYCKKEKLNIAFDSKENFDNNYESNWYYYYK